MNYGITTSLFIFMTSSLYCMEDTKIVTQEKQQTLSSYFSLLPQELRRTIVALTLSLILFEEKEITVTKKPILSIDYNSKNKTVLVGLLSNKALLLNTLTKEPKKCFFVKGDWISSVALSSTGETALTASKTSCIVWDSDTGQELRILTGHEDRIKSVAFSPDNNRILTGSRDSTAHIYDTKTGGLLSVLAQHSGWINEVAYNSDGSIILTGSQDSTACLWNSSTGFLLKELRGHSKAVCAVAFSPDSETALTGSLDKTARLWNISTGEPLQLFKGHTGTVSSVAFSPDGKTIVTGSYDTTVRLWDAQTGQLLQTLTGHTNYVNKTLFSQDGETIITCSSDKALIEWKHTLGWSEQKIKAAKDLFFYKKLYLCIRNSPPTALKPLVDLI